MPVCLQWIFSQELQSWIQRHCQRWPPNNNDPVLYQIPIGNKIPFGGNFLLRSVDQEAFGFFKYIPSSAEWSLACEQHRKTILVHHHGIISDILVSLQNIPKESVLQWSVLVRSTGPKTMHFDNLGSSLSNIYLKFCLFCFLFRIIENNGADATAAQTLVGIWGMTCPSQSVFSSQVRVSCD